jgi:P-type Mg2+ transporter
MKGATMNNNPDNVAADQFHASPRGYKVRSPWMRNTLTFLMVVEGLLSQTLIVHMIGTRRVPFFQSWPCAPLLFTTMVIVAIGAILPFSPIGSAIGLVRLPPVYFFWLAGILFSYCLVVQTVKMWFLKQFKAWI